MEKTCYVLSRYIASNESVSVFWNEGDARNRMNDELEEEIDNLKEFGFQCKFKEAYFHAEVIVPDTDIVCFWNIVKTTIQ